MRAESCSWAVMLLTRLLVSPSHDQQSVLAGVVLLAETGQPLPEVEATLLDLQRSALSNAAGRFRIDAVPAGSYTLRLRRIGYQPLLVRISVAEAAPPVDTFRLQKQAVTLPELAVEGRLPRPSFNLQVAYPIDVNMSLTHPPQEYLPLATVVTDDMEAFVFMAPPKGTEPLLSGRRWWHELSGYVMLGASGFPCQSPNAGPIAIQLLDDTPVYLALYADGLVKVFTPQRHSQRPSCAPLYRMTTEIHPMHAAGSGGRWVITALDAAGAPVALGVDPSGIRWRLALSPWLSAEDLATALVAARGAVATIAANRWPFPWIALDSSGAVLASGAGPATEARDSSVRSERFKGAEAFPVLPIEGGYVQTLVGPSGEPRLNVVYDLLGRIVSRQEALGIPLLLASAPTARRVLGVHLVPNRRRVGHLVEYSY